MKIGKPQLVREFDDFSNLQTKKYINLRAKVVEEIVAIQIGCLNSCPFCGEICISGKNHGGDHHTHHHRPQGVTGYALRDGNGKLIIENCQQLVGGNGSFQSFKNRHTDWKSHPYKEYRQVNSDYASWQINSDLTLESGSYWKWFMKTYSSQLAKLYEASEADIPESWNSLTKEQEIEKLRKLIPN